MLILKNIEKKTLQNSDQNVEANIDALENLSVSVASDSYILNVSSNFYFA